MNGVYMQVKIYATVQFLSRVDFRKADYYLLRFLELRKLKNSKNLDIEKAVTGALWQLEGKEKHIEWLEKSKDERQSKRGRLSDNLQCSSICKLNFLLLLRSQCSHD